MYVNVLYHSTPDLARSKTFWGRALYESPTNRSGRLAATGVGPGEVRKIDLFSSLGESFRCRTVKSKVPQIIVVIRELPSGNARKKSVHNDELLDFCWKLRSIGVCDHQADVVANNPGFGNAEGFRQGVIRMAAVFMSEPPFGMSESPIPGRSGAMRVNFSFSFSIRGRHIREV